MATITEEKVVVRKDGVTKTIFMTEDTDLWFGLRGAGETTHDDHEDDNDYDQEQVLPSSQNSWSMSTPDQRHCHWSSL